MTCYKCVYYYCRTEPYNCEWCYGIKDKYKESCELFHELEFIDFKDFWGGL